MNRIFLALILILSWSSSYAYTIYGNGAKSCGYWVERREANDHWTMTQWALGYLSATGYYYELELKEIDSSSITVWFDNYCGKNPLAAFNTAMKQLVSDLSIQPN
jgi:hypothetical protein